MNIINENHPQRFGIRDLPIQDQFYFTYESPRFDPGDLVRYESTQELALVVHANHVDPSFLEGFQSEINNYAIISLGSSFCHKFPTALEDIRDQIRIVRGVELTKIEKSAAGPYLANLRRAHKNVS